METNEDKTTRNGEVTITHVVVIPHFEEGRISSEEVTPANPEAVTGNVVRMTPDVGETPPSAEATKTNGEIPSPHGEETPAHGEGTSPRGEAIKTDGEGISPDGEATKSYGEEVSPHARDPTEYGEETSPDGETPKIDVNGTRNFNFN